MRKYFAFGLHISSDWELPCSIAARQSFSRLRLCQASPDFFPQHVPADHRKPDPRRSRYFQLEDGSRYLLWRNCFEFHISVDSHVIHARSLDGAPEAAFRTYMLGHLLSYALLGMGIETIHAASVVIDGQAIALLGDSARGKSTLSAAFLQAGARLLTDDFLVVREEQGQIVAYPGFPRIKLYERVSKHLIASTRQGVPMTPHHRPKFVFPLEDAITEPVPISRFYALASPRAVIGLKDIWLQPLTEREAYLELTENSFNVSVQTRERLAAQFRWATDLAKRVAVKRLAYPRLLTLLPEVVNRVREDIQPGKTDLTAFATTRAKRSG